MLETDSKKATLLRANAHNYATMIAGVTELKFLRGLDTGEKLDPREKIRATASRVGLSVPRVSVRVGFILVLILFLTSKMFTVVCGRSICRRSRALMTTYNYYYYYYFNYKIYSLRPFFYFSDIVNVTSGYV